MRWCQRRLARAQTRALAGSSRPSQASWDSAAEFAAAGFSGTLIARGITACNFVVWPSSGGTQQTAALHLTSTDASGDSVTLLHTYRTEYVP